MKIRGLRLRNFRAIDDVALDLVDLAGNALDLVMLAGPNGCGKTSVIEACLLALNQDKLLTRKPLDQDYEITLTVEHNDKRYTISREPGQHSVSGGEYGKGHPVTGFLQSLRAFYFSSWRAPKLVGSVGLSTGKGNRPQRTEDNSLWRLKQHLVNIKGAKAYRTPGGGPAVDADEKFDRIAAVWREFYPDRNGRFDAEIAVGGPPKGSSEEDSSEEMRFDVLLRDDAHREGIPIDQLSSGEIEVLSMIGTFVVERTPFEIVFIDEPELHLHLGWHRAVMQALRQASPPTQLICATHSEEVLDSLYSFQRFTLLDSADPRLRLVNMTVVGEGGEA